MRVLLSGSVQVVLQEAACCPCQNGHGLLWLGIGEQVTTQGLDQIHRKNVCVEDVAADACILGQLHDVFDALAVCVNGLLRGYEHLLAVVLIDADCLDTGLHRPVQLGEVELEKLQITVAAEIGQRNGLSVQEGLEPLGVGEVCGHEGQAEGFIPRGHEVCGELGFLVAHDHFHRLHKEVGDRVNRVTLLPEILAFVFKDGRLAPERVHFVGVLNGLVQRLFTVGAAAGMVLFVPLFTE